MVNYEFVSPVEEDAHPPIDRLRDLFLNAGEEYWEGGSGQGMVAVTLNDDPRQITIVYSPLGFYLDYRDLRDRYIALGSDDFQQSVTVHIGGDPVLLPHAFFIPREQAWKIVEEFCQSGELSIAGNWTHRKEIDWDYGLPPKK